MPILLHRNHVLQKPLKYQERNFRMTSMPHNLIRIIYCGKRNPVSAHQKHRVLQGFNAPRGFKSHGSFALNPLSTLNATLRLHLRQKYPTYN